MAEKEYIERESVIELLTNRDVVINPNDEVANIREDVECLPAADVRPVVRGKWEIIDGHRGRCSHCKFVVNPWVVTFYNYCPNCGADMRGEQDEKA